MSTYAVLGATGSTGQSLVKVLSQNPDNKIKAYCRSKSKLLNLIPNISDNKNIEIFEGNLQDISLITSCISNTRAVFQAVAQPHQKPNCTIAIDAARIVVSAMQNLRDNNNSHLPRLIVLSSQSVDPHLSRATPSLINWFIHTALSHVYSDLEIAESYLRSEPWISCTYIKPGALTQDDQKGHALSLDTVNSPVSFMDLAAGMIEVAEDQDETKWQGKNVSVNATARNVRFPAESPMILIKGFFIHFFPSLYTWFY